MDSLTQIVLGAAVGELVLGKKIGNKALLFGAMAGTIPDLDLLQSLIKPMISHRGFTHSFFFAFLMSPILAWLVKKIFKDRKKTIFTNKIGFLDKFIKRFFRESHATFKEWTSLFFWGFVTHILLDVQTIYGTELLWPFRFRLTTSNIFVADPLYTLPFLICVIIVAFLGRNTKLRSKINHLGILISSSYLLLTFVFKGISHYKFTKNLKNQNIEYLRIETGPTPLNSILWYANVETETQYLTGYYSILDKDDKIEFYSNDKNLPLRKKMENFKIIKDLNHFSKDWYLISKNEKDNEYEYTNIRFGSLAIESKKPEYVFSYIIHIDKNDENFKENFNRDGKMREMDKVFSALWERIKGNK